MRTVNRIGNVASRVVEHFKAAAASVARASTLQARVAGDAAQLPLREDGLPAGVGLARAVVGREAQWIIAQPLHFEGSRPCIAGAVLINMIRSVGIFKVSRIIEE